MFVPLPENMAKLEKTSVSDEVHATLVGLIVDGTLKPGEKVRDKELADRLGVSRTPVREALKRLEDARLVKVSAGRWTRVSEVDRDEAEKLYPIVWSLESLAVSFAESRLRDEDLEQMVEANARLKRALEDGDAVVASEADHDFHDALTRRSGNDELTRILRDLKLKLRRIEVLYFGGCVAADKSVEEHEELLDALRANDYPLAAKAVEANYRKSTKRAFEHISAP